MARKLIKLPWFSYVVITCKWTNVLALSRRREMNTYLGWTPSALLCFGRKLPPCGGVKPESSVGKNYPGITSFFVAFQSAGTEGTANIWWWQQNLRRYSLISKEKYETAMISFQWRCVSSGMNSDDRGSKLIWNVGQFQTDYTVQHLRRQSTSYSSLWEPEISPRFSEFIVPVNYATSNGF
jgi:hypothetical protein